MKRKCADNLFITIVNILMAKILCSKGPTFSKKKIFWNRNYLVFSKSTHHVLSSYKLRYFFLNFVQGFTQDESRLQIAHYYTVHKYTSCPKYMYLQNSMEFRARVLEFISLLNIQPYF